MQTGLLVSDELAKQEDVASNAKMYRRSCVYPCKKSDSRISERNLRGRSMHGPRHALALRNLDTYLLVTTLCAARWVSSDMHIDAAEVLAGAEKMVKCIAFKSNDKFRFYRIVRKRFTVFCDCAICYRKLESFSIA